MTTERLDDVELMTRAAEAVFRQGDFGVSETGSCTYLNEARGLSCVAGHALLIAGLPREALWRVCGSAESLSDGIPADHGSDWDAQVKAAVSGRDLSFWQYMQAVHDRAAKRKAHNPSITMLEAVAATLLHQRCSRAIPDQTTFSKLSEIWAEGFRRSQDM